MLVNPVNAPGSWALGSVNRDGLICLNVVHIGVVAQALNGIAGQRGRKAQQGAGIAIMNSHAGAFSSRINRPINIGSSGAGLEDHNIAVRNCVRRVGAQHRRQAGRSRNWLCSRESDDEG